MKQLTAMVPKDLKDRIGSMVPEHTKTTLLMRAFGLTKVPLLFLTSPKVLKIDQSKIEVLIPFRKIVKNHVGSLYFGALAIGADTAVGMLAMDKIYKSQQKATLVFKDFQANFIKRAEGDTLFICEEGEKIGQVVQKALESKERVNEPIQCKAYTNNELVAEFVLTLSIKAK